MFITCLIPIAIIIDDRHYRFNNERITGKVQWVEQYEYVADFREEAKKRHLEGDYEYIRVDKSNCIEQK